MKKKPSELRRQKKRLKRSLCRIRRYQQYTKLRHALRQAIVHIEKRQLLEVQDA